MRALALFSGGLDSMLAIKVIKNQGVDVLALHVDIGFGSRVSKNDLLKSRAQKAGAKLEILDVKKQYLEEVLFTPVYGYGKGFNPCIDCHGFMFRLARELLPKFNTDFIITGEVLGQRPMSQRSSAINMVTNLAKDDEKLILRPLSAKLMQPTLPEINGWVEREKLLDISGRGRERQLALAEEFGFEDYESPGGGCLLTLKAFSDRIKDTTKHDTFTVEDIDLLKHGRHLRLKEGAKLVIGRNEADNEALNSLVLEKYLPINLHGLIGPTSYLHKNASKEDVILALRLVLTYARTEAGKNHLISFGDTDFNLEPFDSKSVAQPFLVN